MDKKKTEELSDGDLDAVQGGCSRVSKVAAIKIEVDLASDQVGDQAQLDTDGIVGGKTIGTVAGSVQSNAGIKDS